MKRLLRGFSRVARRLRGRRSRSAVLPGHVPVYVGEEMRRFAVSTDVINSPILEKLLQRSAEEYGYQQKGILRIPCHVSDFELAVAALCPVTTTANVFFKIKTYLLRKLRD